MEELELQTTFNEDSLDVLADDCEVENIEMEGEEENVSNEN